MKNLGDDDEVLIEDTSNKFWQIGSTKSDTFTLVSFGDKYFQHDKHKTGLFKKPTSQEMLKYCPYKKMAHALRKMDNKMDKQAQQMWKNINSYIGTRKSSKEDSGHVEKLLRFALKAPEELRDEAYLQLCKQTNGNPSNDSLLNTSGLIQRGFPIRFAGILNDELLLILSNEFVHVKIKKSIFKSFSASNADLSFKLSYLILSIASFALLINSLKKICQAFHL